MRQEIKQKNIYLVEDKISDELIQLLVGEFGLPFLSSSLALYSEHKGQIVEIKFQDSECYFKTHNKQGQQDENHSSSTPPIKIGNKNIKHFLRTLYSLNFDTAFITGEVKSLDFMLADGDSRGVSLKFDTPIGDLIVLRGCDKESSCLKDCDGLKYLTTQDIDTLFSNQEKQEKVVEEFSVLNEKIVNYGNKFGINLSASQTANIETKLSAKSNDYTDIEVLYERITGYKLNEISAKKDLRQYFLPFSIIIPSCNSENTILQTLYSIQSQDLNSEQKNTVEVIIVDDGSDVPVADVLEGHMDQFEFCLNIIRTEQNKGLSHSRNIGASSASYERLLFIDSDILLQQNYLLEHSLALQIFPNAVYVSMKNNIKEESLLNNNSTIRQGLDFPRKYDDKRITRQFSKDQPWVNEVSLSGEFDILDETNRFKQFGYGRKVNGYDLPSAVVGHNMTITKNLLNKAGWFSDHFQGWGLEDTYFGARLISEGAFVVPLLKTGVYHIDHPPRSGNKEQKEKEYRKNLEKYKSLIREPF